MTSPNGINWTTRTAATDIFWQSVAFRPASSGVDPLFVAVARTGSGNRVMTSTNGITWTIRASPDNSWTGVTYGNGMFVAVGSITPGGVGLTGVMTSTDGTNWAVGSTPADNTWNSVTFGNGRFVAVANSSTVSGTRVMTSP